MTYVQLLKEEQEVFRDRWIKSLFVVQFSTSSKVTICRWIARFKRGHMSLYDEEFPEPPKRVTIPKVIENVLYVVLHERRVRVWEIA